MKKRSANKISDEMLAAFLDGNATAHESQVILNGLSDDENLIELLHISKSVDAELGMTYYEEPSIPMTAVAASCPQANLCTLECEKYVLDKFNIEFNAAALFKESVEHGWLHDNGTALHDIGRLLEKHGLHVTRQYNCSIETLAKAIEEGESVIVAVDGGELLGNKEEELYEDIFIGEIPDHTVVVTSCDIENGTVTLFDPNSAANEDTYPIWQFVDAWNDSKNFMLSITPCGCKQYIPKPIDISNIRLDKELNELSEIIAENAHEVWAHSRQAEGWTYGPERNDALKQTPDMVPYAQLPESEKKYDRDMAMQTIKLLKKLGYDIIKQKDSTRHGTIGIHEPNAHGRIYCPTCGSPLYNDECAAACAEPE